MNNDDIEHSIVTDMLRITMLVYNYGKTLILPEPDADQDQDQDNTIESFVSDLQSTNKFADLKLSDTRKNILTEIAKSVPSGKLYDFIDDEDSDLQVGITICKGKKRICVVFRGSESRSDWYYDLMITKRRLFNSVCVHKGFYRQLTSNNTYNTILSKLSELSTVHPDYQVYITGHSLGGALATLFGYMISDTIKNNIIVASFASPRVGNYAWKKDFETKKNLTHYRISNKRDIVTAFPCYKYHHVGTNIQLSDNKSRKFTQFYVRKWWEESIFTCWKPSEHDCELYYKRLLKNAW
jgi:predicted lipase